MIKDFEARNGFNQVVSAAGRGVYTASSSKILGSRLFLGTLA